MFTPTSSAPQSLPLSDTEIQRILAAQQGIPPEEPQYEPIGDTAIGQGNDFSGGLATDAADNLSADFIHSQIQASAVEGIIADMSPPIGAVPDTPVQVPAPLPEQTQPPAEQPQTQTAQPENPIPSVDAVQAPPAAEAEKHPEETAKTLAGDIASQINTTADLLAKPLEERAQVLQRTAELKSELAATYANGMITFQNGEMPVDAADFYARNPGALAETVETMQQHAKEMHKIGGESAGKAYLMGVVGKLAGGAGNGLDILELGRRVNKAYHEDTQSNWDSVYGQLSKIMVGAAGGVAAVGVARAAGALIAGFLGGAPIIATIIVGAGLTIGVSLVADYIESEISKGNTILSAPVDDVTDLVLVGDMHLPIDARLRADNVTVFGNQRFDNIEIEADKVEIVGGISSEGNFIVHAEEVSVTQSENVSQTLLEKAQAEAVAQTQQSDADSAAEPEMPADIPVETVQSEIPQQPADTQISLPASTENRDVIGYNSPENILPDGSRIDDEMFLYYEFQESLLSESPMDNVVPEGEPVNYPNAVQTDIGLSDIYDDYIM